MAELDATRIQPVSYLQDDQQQQQPKRPGGAKPRARPRLEATILQEAGVDEEEEHQLDARA